MVEPTFFAAAGELGRRPRFAMLHHPAGAATASAGAARGVALVIVPPFGYEAVCAHRALRVLGETAALAGVLAVRVDLDGTGDSAGDDLDPGRVDAWLASILDACDLARSTGAERIVLAGVRLGATLALLAAGQRDDIAAVAAIAPIAKGRAFVREQRMLQTAMALAPAPPGYDAHVGRDGDATEVAGFALTAETAAAVSAIDLTKLTRRPAPRIALLDRDDLPANDALAAHLRELGADVQARRLPGYVGITLDAHRTVVPDAIIAAVVELATTLPAVAPSERRSPPPLERATRIVHGDGHRAIVEEAITIEDRLHAIATRPAHGPPPRRALVLLNAGAVRRIGPNRMYVTLARRLTASAGGPLVVRVDLSGIGESAARPGGTANVCYFDGALADVDAAARWCRAAGATEVTVAGICSGGYHSLRTAIADVATPPAITGVIAINPYIGPPFPSDEDWRRVQAASQYNSSMRKGASWMKLLRGQVDLGRVARVVASRARTELERVLRDTARRLHLPLRDDFGSELRALCRRGVAVRFVFAPGEPGRIALRDQGGSVVPQLTRSGHVVLDEQPDADHTFTARWAQHRLLDALAALFV